MGNKTVLFLLLGGTLAACSPLDVPLPGGDHRRPGSGAAPVAPQTPDLPEPAPPVPDTILYASAVRFPDDYDWQRDSAYSTVPFELILYRDDDPVLTLAWDAEACFGPDPDRHHLLDGHLYTDRMSGAQTRVGCDGKELFRFDGREFLVGLLPDGPDLYTLSRKTSGMGFSYRKNGVLLLESRSGIPFGDLTDPSYGPTGALYRDNGVLVFCYQDGMQLCPVRNGVAHALEDPYLPGAVLDCKIRDGRALLLQKNYLGQSLRTGRIWFQPTGSVVTGVFTSGQPKGYTGWVDSADDALPRQLCREEATVYYSPEGTWAVAAGTAGTVRWYGPSGAGIADPPARFFSPRCAALAGGRLVLALTPLDTALTPRIRWGARQKEFHLNGYISSVAVELSLPAS